MYNSNMHRINRSPDAGDGGGSLPAAATPTAADSTPAPAAAAPEYLSKSDFESFRNEITGHLQKLTPRQQAAQDAKDPKPSDPSSPDLTKYDFSKPDEVIRLQQDSYKYFRHQEKTAEAKENAEKAAQERQEKTLRGHQARVAEYRKENPTFDADAKKANLMGEAEVTQAIFSHKESPAIIHHMTRNPALADELNQLALSGDVYAVHQRVGELAAEIRAERKVLEANADAAATKIPRQNFSKGSKGASHEMTLEERYERNRS